MIKFICNTEKAKNITQELANRSDMLEVYVKTIYLFKRKIGYFIKFKSNK